MDAKQKAATADRLLSSLASREWGRANHNSRRAIYAFQQAANEETLSDLFDAFVKLARDLEF